MLNYSYIDIRNNHIVHYNMNKLGANNNWIDKQLSVPHNILRSIYRKPNNIQSDIANYSDENHIANNMYYNHYTQDKYQRNNNFLLPNNVLDENHKYIHILHRLHLENYIHILQLLLPSNVHYNNYKIHASNIYQYYKNMPNYMEHNTLDCMNNFHVLHILDHHMNKHIRMDYSNCYYKYMSRDYNIFQYYMNKYDYADYNIQYYNHKIHVNNIFRCYKNM